MAFCTSCTVEIMLFLLLNVSARDIQKMAMYIHVYISACFFIAHAARGFENIPEIIGKFPDAHNPDPASRARPISPASAALEDGGTESQVCRHAASRKKACC